jgi:hypothetical protein
MQDLSRAIGGFMFSTAFFRRRLHGMARAHVVILISAVAIVSACRTAMPSVAFAPIGTDVARLRSDFALTDADRRALTQENIKALTQEQVDQIYMRLASGPMPDGPFRGDLFFPRDRSGRASVRDLPDPAPSLLAHAGALKAERLGRALWRGKVFFRAQGILRNRIEDIAILKPFITDMAAIPKLTFDGQTTWLLFPARLSCGDSRLDPTHRSIVIDYSRGSEVEGYRPVPDRLAGPEGLNIRDEVRIVRPGFYLGRAYFGERFALNFTLLDPASDTGAAPSINVQEDCDGARTGRN